ncbi:hypothetical protein C9J20_13665 [Photobacterium phosphoreum]|uniref:hypothetical protein n=1 Tax=Photobacterium phosphoreum TaxID=659 RepID=UPI000D15C437|nr:hypothetical protein [Photobacterium phosphoreum]PSU66571.1 hypothetical protein CTM79_18940 [Photobacterium phosphoreum]PSW10702.1 hypothetical protein C9J20_13665 [Photobacterium phosphoreum]
MSSELTKELVIERYKFIQQKQMHLDAALHANITLLVKVLIGLFSVVFAIATYHLKEPESVTQETVLLLLEGASLLMLFVSIFFFLITISNIFSWLGYRNDEVELLNDFGGALQRQKPKLSNFLAWQETWFSISLVLFMLGAYTVWQRATEIVVLFLG